MRFPLILILIVLIVCPTIGSSLSKTGGRATTKQTALVDAPLDDATVAGWFDSSIKQGNGQPCAIRMGNEVTELVDGVAAMKAMSDTMRAARPNLTVLKTFGATP